MSCFRIVWTWHCKRGRKQQGTAENNLFSCGLLSLSTCASVQEASAPFRRRPFLLAFHLKNSSKTASRFECAAFRLRVTRWTFCVQMAAPLSSVRQAAICDLLIDAVLQIIAFHLRLDDAVWHINVPQIYCHGLFWYGLLFYVRRRTSGTPNVSYSQHWTHPVCLRAGRISGFELRFIHLCRWDRTVNTCGVCGIDKTFIFDFCRLFDHDEMSLTFFWWL